MTAHELIESGIIEAYCLGIATPEEVELVNHFVLIDDAVREELEAVTNALAKYEKAHAAAPPESVRQRVLAAVDNNEKPIAPLLTAASTVEEWLRYLESINVTQPGHFQGIYPVELPSDDTRYTYIAWANEGDRQPDEVHDDETEYLFICTGACEMKVDGKKTQYKKGDLITIHKGQVHSATVISKETMLIVVQRRAA